MIDKKSRIDFLVEYLNERSDEYYNKNAPTISDAEFDALFDELSALEKETGYIRDDSPTKNVGAAVVDGLMKVTHSIPLLSLAKTKDPADVYKMAQTASGYLGLKMDGLTVKLTFERGVLIEAATRGNGEIGEIVTHTAKTFINVPKKIDFQGRLVVTGEAFIDIPTFERINEEIERDEDKFSTPRNLAAGSVRQLDSTVTAKRRVRFMPFSVLEGFENIPLKSARLNELNKLGFDRLPCEKADKNDTLQSVKDKLFTLKKAAEKLGFPIDGVVFTYDDAAFAASLGRTSHHFKDGIAFKFGDPESDTVLRNIEWNISRSGQLTPVAVFDPCEIDGTNVERASLHNISFIDDLKLMPGDRIRVSKRNMIIPHIEENYDGKRNGFTVDFPLACPVCGGKTAVTDSENQGRIIRVLYCANPRCPGKRVKEFTHFVSKSAMNIEGLSEQTLMKFISLGLLHELGDIFTLESRRDKIISVEGFGEKSFDNLINSINAARHCRMSNFLVALNIPLIGSAAARDIESVFSGDMNALLSAVKDGYDFASIENFGGITNEQIHLWFDDPENAKTVDSLLPYLTFEALQKTQAVENGVFANKTCVITGAFEEYSRDELSEILRERGANVTGSVSKKTDIVVCGENAGSKLDKAKALSIRIIYADELRGLLG